MLYTSLENNVQLVEVFVCLISHIHICLNLLIAARKFQTTLFPNFTTFSTVKMYYRTCLLCIQFSGLCHVIYMSCYMQHEGLLLLRWLSSSQAFNGDNATPKECQPWLKAMYPVSTTVKHVVCELLSHPLSLTNVVIKQIPTALA